MAVRELLGVESTMPVNSETFRRALGRFASGVTVVTTSDGTQRAGLTVSAFCSVSLTPPYILVCIDQRSQAIDILRRSCRFAVNFLAEEQSDLSTHFASKLPDKFSGVPYRLGALGVPLLDDTLGYLECTLVQEIPAGDHFIYVGQVEYADVNDAKRPLLYYHSQYQSVSPLVPPAP
jgi:flavin reductase (DIM6/NTAB) family NADH-FMN oxidoreductase RutF